MINLKKYKNIINKILLIILIIIVLLMYLKIKTINTIVNIIFIGFILAYALKPIRNGISEKFRISKKISSIGIIIAIFVVIIISLYLIIPVIIKESSTLGTVLDNIDDYIYKLGEKLNISDMSYFELLYKQVNEQVNYFLSSFSNNFLDNIIDLFDNIISCAIVPIVTYYFLVDGDLIYNKVLLILPTEKRVIAKKSISNIDKILSRYIISQLFLSAIIGVLTFVMLMIIDVKFAFILALLNGVLNIIPYFGPIIGGVPAVFVALLDSPGKALWTIIGVFIIQQLEGNILSPKITGDSTNMHPIIIIILLLIGEKLGGFAGMILAVPIGVIIKVIYDDINDYLF